MNNSRESKKLYGERKHNITLLYKFSVNSIHLEIMFILNIDFNKCYNIVKTEKRELGIVSVTDVPQSLNLLSQHSGLIMVTINKEDNIKENSWESWKWLPSGGVFKLERGAGPRVADFPISFLVFGFCKSLHVQNIIKMKPLIRKNEINLKRVETPGLWQWPWEQSKGGGLKISRMH